MLKKIANKGLTQLQYIHTPSKAKINGQLKTFFTAKPITLKENWSRCLYVMPFPVITTMATHLQSPISNIDRK